MAIQVNVGGALYDVEKIYYLKDGNPVEVDAGYILKSGASLQWYEKVESPDP